MQLHTIDTGNFKLDGGAMFGVVPKILWQELYPADEKNRCNLTMRSLLIEEDDKKILIDTGIGDKQDEKFFSLYGLNGEGNLMQSIEKAGYHPDEITDVIHTHLHFDHCGGSVKFDKNTNTYSPAFPNAVYWTSKQQWELAHHPNKREKASFFSENYDPLQEHGQSKLIEKNTSLTKNIELRLYNGHTEGMIVPVIRYKDKTLVYVADLMPSAAHIPLAWLCAYDVRPLTALEEKENFLQEAYNNNYTLFFEHDIFNECCTLKETKKGIRKNESVGFEEFLNT